jgi:manganese/zinc/iron transport system substrate-binding protein
MRNSKIFIVLSTLILLTACQPNPKSEEDTRLYVVSTTGMLHDAVLNIGGDLVRPEVIMGPGVDPHLYKATQGDLRRLREADLVIYNGLSLEGKMGEILEKLSRNKPVIAAAENAPKEQLLQAVDYQNSYDPHLWFDVSLWKYAVQAVRDALMKEDPENADTYRTHAEQYLDEIERLHRWVTEEIREIPAEKRILITAHDAFQYFGRAYDIEVVGIQGVSTVADVSLRNVTDIIDLIIDRGIKSIFVETSVSNRTIQAVVDGCKEKGHDVKIGGSLFSDAMGEPDTAEGSYVGMVRHNVEAISQGLKDE